MIADLDSILTGSSVDAVIVPMHEAASPSFRWLTCGAKVTRGIAIKVAGREPLLIHFPMERDEAGATGIATQSINDFGWAELARASASPAHAWATVLGRILDALGAPRRIAFSGLVPIDLYIDVIALVEEQGREIHHARGTDLLERARKRKDAEEIEKIRSVGERTEAVVEGVRRILRSATIRDGEAWVDGRRLMIGDLKRFVSEEIYRLGMLEDHETILSQGRDAGVPHSRGDAAAVVRASSPLIIDIFPVDRESGYFFDLTRTFCIGPIPERLARIHADVLAAYRMAEREMAAGSRASDHQRRVCAWFEERGYPTILSTPATDEGYVHGLGHGVGLNVHEAPSFQMSESNRDTIEIGDILTIEPGLYFPEDGIGVRIEDTFVIGEDGRAHSLSSGDRSLQP